MKEIWVDVEDYEWSNGERVTVKMITKIETPPKILFISLLNRGFTAFSLTLRVCKKHYRL